MRRLACLVFLVCGCSAAVPPTPSPTETKKVDPVFRGKKAKARIDWPLAGTWNVQRFETEERPSKMERWESKWILKEKHVSIANEMVFDDENGQGEFYLSRVSIPHPTDTNGVPDRPAQTGDMLIWAKPNGTARFFSINWQSFGFLIMTGDDGEQYMAVRID